jgi:uncharacterized protein YndB with AHSA1/START domain
MDGQFGQLEQAGSRWRLRFTRRLRHPPAKVWRALTEPAQLAAWFPTDIEGERAAGAALRFVFRNGEGPTLDGEITAYEPPLLLEFRWGEETLRFELRPDGAGSELTFLNSFDEIGKGARDAAGWHVCLDALGCQLDGDTPPWATRDRWREVHAVYVERFGPEASSIGPPPRGGAA